MRVGVLGVGGLGHLALQFARAMGCEVTALSSSPDKEEDARRFGAHHFVVTEERKALRSLARTLDVIVSTVFVDQEWKRFVSALRPNGTLCLVGVPAEPLSLPAGSLIGGQRSVTGSAIGGRPGHPRDAGVRRPARGPGRDPQVRPMAEADAALDETRHGRARYRVVLAR